MRVGHRSLVRQRATAAALLLICIFLIEVLAPALNASVASANLQPASSLSPNTSAESETSSLGPMQTGTVKVSISLAARNAAQLDSFTSSNKTQQNGVSQALSEAQFEADFSPAQADYDRALAYLVSQNLTVTQTWTNRLLIDAEGSVSDVERAFDTEIGLFSYMNQTFYKSVNPITVPSALTGCGITEISVDSFPVTSYVNVEKGHIAPAATSNALLFGSPSDFRTLYGTTQAIQNGWNGTGTTIAIVDAYGDPTIVSDVNLFDAEYNLPDINLTVVGTSGSDNQWALETALDVEWAHAMAPGATIKLQLSQDESNPNMFAALQNLVASQNPPNVISLSWGISESLSLNNAYSNIFAAAAAKGIEVYASTGDYGAHNNKQQIGFSVNYPASNPNVVAVGGTEVYYNTVQGVNQTYENGWSGSGGGYSALFSEPNYQKSAGIPNPTGKREIPDVSLDAGSASPVNIFEGGSETGVYGTSLASPLMAAIAAVALNEGYNLNNTALYSMYSSSSYGVAFHDIYLSGNNGYPVQQGWDAVTGLGTINFQNFVAISGQSSGVSLAAQSLTPSVLMPGQSFSLNYTINNPNSAVSMTQIGLGASIRLHGANASINDASNDIYLNVQGGLSNQTRQFSTTASLAQGSYDVNWQVWMGQPGFGNLLSSSGWQMNQLQIGSVPTATVMPGSWTMDVGQSELFTANPSGGSGSYSSYQWYLNGASQNGATSQTFNYQATSAGSPTITVTVTDALGLTSTQSTAPSVTVNSAPSVNVSPTLGTIDVGQPQQFTAHATGGSTPLNYQWYLAGSAVPGETGSTYTYTASFSGFPQIYCNVTDSASHPVTVQSNTPSVTVNPALNTPAVFSSASTINQGQSSTLSVTDLTGGTTPYSYQWLQKAPSSNSYLLINGATLPSYAFMTSSSNETGGWSFEVQVADATGASVTSNPVSVTLNFALEALTVTSTLDTVNQGQASTLSSSTITTGTLPYTYLWLSESPGTSSYTPINDATASNYNFATSASTATGTWRFILQITDGAGTQVNSTVTTVTVNAPTPTANPTPTPTIQSTPSTSPTQSPTPTPTPTPNPAVISTATSTATVTQNSATVDQTSATGVNVTVSGSSLQEGARLNVTSIYYGDNAPQGTGAVSVNGAVFYDVRVTSSSGALSSSVSVTVSLTNPDFTSASVIKYWNGNTWVAVATTFTAPHTVSGKFPASALTGTPILVGVPKASTPISFALIIIVSAVVAVVLILGVVFVYVKKRPWAKNVL